jgi:hypothetical protein
VEKMEKLRYKTPFYNDEFHGEMLEWYKTDNYSKNFTTPTDTKKVAKDYGER